MSEILLEGDALAIANELRTITHTVRDLDARATALKEQLRSLLSAGDTAVSPDGVELLTVRHGTLRFDPAKATNALPPSVLESISVTAPDAKRAKEILAPTLYTLCCTRAADSIVVKP